MKKVWISLIGVVTVFVLSMGVSNSEQVKQSADFMYMMSEGDHH